MMSTQSRLVLQRKLIFLLLCWCLTAVVSGCSTIKTVTDYDLFHDQEVLVITHAHQEYTLDKNWSSDSLGNITGSGKVRTKQLVVKPFKGTIPANSISAVRYWEYDEESTYLLAATIIVQAAGITAAIVSSKSR